MKKKPKEIKVVVTFASGDSKKFTETVLKFFEKNPDVGKKKVQEGIGA